MHDRIKALRKSLGLTQAAFGDRIAVKPNTITNYETGLRVPSNSVIASICREFHVSEAWLRTGEGDMFLQRTMNQELALMVNDLMSEADESFRKRFFSALLSLPPDFWPELEKFLKKMSRDE